MLVITLLLEDVIKEYMITYLEDEIVQDKLITEE